ncbi:hypothetical protein MPC38_07425 [Prescottella equi]|uniref:hypothetical protein n=1 Tax=Rhodococcus hoagii TaxID=43767 RepID=UPI0011AF6530|nr:hypothetical protein [Prescottella equi]NKS86356.1 hypothetical protein [Prescottella equi]NKT12927.1 hypothetical protein [Prescottella equi]NKW45193.1 hypothetical protein [Prescottella equi]UNQ41076.1 hypothetical protein MPC38_07425 [Prescottella equi]BCN58064.1 hypothetical protein RE9427_14340 [Prescottella equi]
MAHEAHLQLSIPMRRAPKEISPRRSPYDRRLAADPQEDAHLPCNGGASKCDNAHPKAYSAATVLLPASISELRQTRGYCTDGGISPDAGADV